MIKKSKELKAKIRKTAAGFQINMKDGYVFRADEYEAAIPGYKIYHTLNGEQVGKVEYCIWSTEAKAKIADRAEKYLDWKEQQIAKKLSVLAS